MALLSHVLFSHGPGTPLFITPNFSYVRPPVVDAPYTVSPLLYASVAVLVVILLAAITVVARRLARRDRGVSDPQSPAQISRLISRT